MQEICWNWARERFWRKQMDIFASLSLFQNSVNNSDKILHYKNLTRFLSPIYNRILQETRQPGEQASVNLEFDPFSIPQLFFQEYGKCLQITNILVCWELIIENDEVISLHNRFFMAPGCKSFHDDGLRKTSLGPRWFIDLSLPLLASFSVVQISLCWCILV